MAAVLQLTKKIIQRPTLPEVAGVHLRHFVGTADVEPWLELRRRAFARQKLGVRDWNAEDFAQEFLRKPWWQPEAMWLAEAQPLLMPTELVGSVTLARRGDAVDGKPVVHWLCVLPGYRRRGIGRLLLAALEAAVWDAGERQVWLETHEAWSEAARLYAASGYRPA
jgi:GNAT superfamily N-acetyltransferase